MDHMDKACRSTSVSVVCTVLNEESTIADLLDSLLAQSLSPAEIIIVDGGSTDDTASIVQRYAVHDQRVKFYLLPGANRSVGRNSGIQHASTEIVAITDGGCVAGRYWLERICTPFRTKKVDVVGGGYRACAHNRVQQLIAEALVPRMDAINPENFLPTSRSLALRKKAWEAVNGYPENFDENEDTIFDLRLKRAGYRFAFVSDAIVYWQPRSSLRALFKQYYRFGVGDGKARVLWHRYLRLSSKHIIAFIVVVMAIAISPLFVLALIGGLLLYVVRGRQHLFRGNIVSVLFKVLAISVHDLASIVGYGVGVIKDLASGRKWSRSVSEWSVQPVEKR